MTEAEFIRAAVGRPWVNRACSMEAMDCWGLVVLYHRHVLGIELHDVPGYESGADFITCHDAEATFWCSVSAPAAGDIAVFYRGSQPAHIGVMLTPARCLHARGENGFVRIDNPLALLKIYTRVEYMTYGQI